MENTRLVPSPFIAGNQLVGSRQLSFRSNKHELNLEMHVDVCPSIRLQSGTDNERVDIISSTLSKAKIV